MCEPTTIALGAAALAGGAVLSSAMAPKTPSVKPTDPVQPPVAKQGEKAADVDQLRRSNSGNRIDTGPGASSGSTLLTGPGGIDSEGLSLNKNTLLGG